VRDAIVSVGSPVPRCDEEPPNTAKDRRRESEAVAGAAKMWCLVSQANSVILEVQVDPKAIGQECLEKVSTRASLYVRMRVCLCSC